MRSYREQFEPHIADRVGVLIDKLAGLSYPTGPSRYYGLDLAACLSVGALAASLIVASSFMELYVRALVVCYSESAQRSWARQIEIERELEDMKSIGFKQLIDHLVTSGLFDRDSADEVKSIYENVRIPAHHGLPSRLIGRPETKFLAEMFGEVGRSDQVSMKEFESFVECEALPIIERIVCILEQNQIARHT